MPNKSRLLLLALCLCGTPLFGQKDTAKIGVFVTNLYDFNIADGSYVAEFWTWALFRNDSLDFDNRQEVTNSKKSAFSNGSREKKGGLNWSQQKCTTAVIYDWDVRNFPFDRQRLMLSIEDALADTSALVYLADTANSRVNAALSLDEWDIDGFTSEAGATTYNTTYGDPELVGSSAYPVFKASIGLTRKHCWTQFWKLVTGVYVAFLISILVFWIQPPQLDTRIGLAVGGLFAAVGNKYIVENIVPTTTQTTMIDLIHMTTFAAILLIVFATVYLSRLEHMGQPERSARLEKRAAWLILAGYAVLNVFFVLHALALKGQSAFL